MFEDPVIPWTATPTTKRRWPGGVRLSGFERWGTATTAAALMVFGMRHRSAPGVLLLAAAIPLAYRGLAGDWPPVGSARHRARRDGAGEAGEALASGRGIDVREAVRLEKPRPEVFRFWRGFENLPRVMTNLHKVVDVGNGRSRWIAKGPAGVTVAWDAEIVNEVENEVIAWRSLPGADVVMAGSVRFNSVRLGRSTELLVHMRYAPLGGRAGALAAWVAGREPSQAIREDLRRLKQIVETGEIARTASQESGS
jgi:uncharacterized membrane protein